MAPSDHASTLQDLKELIAKESDVYKLLEVLFDLDAILDIVEMKAANIGNPEVPPILVVAENGNRNKR
jgi:hypothetical protein